MKLNLPNLTIASSVLVVFTLFFKENLNSMALIVFVTFTLVLQYRSKHTSFFFHRKTLMVVIPLLLYFILALIGFVSNPESNGDYLVRLLLFLIAPLCYYFFQRVTGSKKIVIVAFVIATSLFLVFLDSLALWDMISAKSVYVEQNGRKYYRFIYTRLTQDYFNHIYLSTYIVMAIMLLLQFKPIQNRKISGILIAYFLFHLLILSSRAVIISGLIGGLILFVILSIKNRKKLKYLLYLLVFLLLSSAIVYQYRDTLLLNRYSQVFDLYTNREKILQRNYSVNNRIKVYIIGASLLKEKSLYGINGTGLSYKIIKEQYDTAFKDDFPFETSTFNTHNQYINNFIDWGIMGLLLTLWLLYKPIAAAFNARQYWMAVFWVSFVFVLTMESFLIRQRGIVFFIMFYTLMCAYDPGSPRAKVAETGTG